MNKTLVFWLKLLLTLAVIAFIIREVWKDWEQLSGRPFRIDAGYILAAIAAFMGFMIQSSLVWRWLARRMGDRTPALQAVGAYTYSQMGKYVPGKVALLLMRITRSGRVGMETQTCIVATLVENAMYMVSGAILAAATLMIYARENLFLVIPLCIGIIAMVCIFHPKIFYWAVNRVLRKMKRAEVPETQRLHGWHMAGAVIGFFPCWILGGVSLWCATRGIVIDGESHSPPELIEFLKFPGVVAIGVVSGMAFLTPGGVGTREYAMGILLTPMIGKQWATMAVVLQRLVQLVCELVLGGIGAIITRKKNSAATPSSAPSNDQSITSA